MSKKEPDIHQLFDLTGRVAMISGGSGYLGSALSRALAEAGATVVATSRNAGRAAAVADALPKPGDAAHIGVELDHMDETSIERGFKEALERAGKIDVLVNNGHEHMPHDWTDVTGEQFTRQMANATGYFLLARLLRHHAVERGGGGSIILLGSMYGVVGSYPDAYEGISIASPAPYHALKGGIIHLTRHLAVYWAKDQVRVNCLSPGPFPSPKASKAMVQRLTAKSLMKRMGSPHELKGAVVFLASDASSYMTGQNMLIDGGWSSW